MRQTLPSAVYHHLFAVAVTAAAVALRWVLSPWLGSDLPLVTLFAAVAEPEAKFGPSKVEEALQVLDVDGMSPREAMDALYRLKGLMA